MLLLPRDTRLPDLPVADLSVPVDVVFEPLANLSGRWGWSSFPQPLGAEVSWPIPPGKGQIQCVYRFFILKTLNISLPVLKIVCVHVTCQDCPLLA